MADVDLGFAEAREDPHKWLCNRYFPSKVGGRPAWLELDTLPQKDSLLCSKCKDPMLFLCQIYAPGEEEHDFHRSIYIFICRAPGCQTPNESTNFAVFRSQLPLKNDFYPTEAPSEDGDPEPEIPSKRKLCEVCGCPAPYACGACKKVNYCSLKHQRIMWAFHKKGCGDGPPLPLGCGAQMPDLVERKILFPECEIVIEPNNPSNDKKTNKNDSEKDDEKRLEEFEALASEGKTGTFSDIPDAELEKYAQSSDIVDDKYFQRFKEETSNEPEQIIRYTNGGMPLWITDPETTIAAQLKAIPKCELCGAERQFEFQIMPQFLLLFKDDILDWGILAVYTCKANCQIPKEVGYARECIVKQDLIDEEK